MKIWNANVRTKIPLKHFTLANKIIFSRNFLFFPSKIYKKDSVIPLQNVSMAILKDGMQKNARFIGEGMDSAHPVMQIDRK